MIAKIETTDKKTKVVIKQWMQLKILEETDEYIIVSGYNKLIDLVLFELIQRKKRHPNMDYKIGFLERYIKNA